LLILAGLFIFIPYSKNIVKPSFCASAGLWLLINIFRHKRRFYLGLISPNPLNVPLLVFLGASILSIIFSLNPYHSQSVFFDRYLPYAVFFWMSLSLMVRGKKEVSKINLYFLMGAFILSGIIFGLGGVYDYFRLHPGRIWAVFGREIPFKMFPVYLVCFIPFSFALFLFSKKWVRWIGLISLVPLAFC